MLYIVYNVWIKGVEVGNLEKKANKKQKRIEKIEKCWQEKYGVSYTEIIKEQQEKKSEGKKGFHYSKKYFSYFLKDKKLITFAMIFILLATLLNIFVPILTERFFAGVTEFDWQKSLIYAGVICLFILFSAIFQYIYSLITSKIILKSRNRLSQEVSKKVMNARQECFVNVGSGEIASKTISAPSALIDRYYSIIGHVFNMITNFATTIYIFTLNVYLALILFLWGLAIAIIRVVEEKKVLTKYYKANWKARDIVSNKVTETVRGSMDIKALNIKNESNFEIEKLTKKRDNTYYDIEKKTTIFSVLTSVVGFIFFLSFCIVSIALMRFELLAISAFLVAFTQRRAVLNMFSYGRAIYKQLVRAENDAERINEVLSDKKFPGEVFGNVEISKFKGRLEFKNVSFSYEKSEENVLENLSFKIKSGQKIAIVGRSGQGKTTIINLMNKMLDATSGEILLDGENIQTLTEKSIRSNISLVTQTPYIFNATLRENLLLSKPEATEEELLKVCQQAQIMEFIQDRDEGLDTKLGEGGINLSGGQKQRVAIARALLRDSKILLLDEATSALDNICQDSIKKTISTLEKKTIIIIAHRLSTVVDCDRILVLHEGKIVADGKHNELLQTSTHYKELYAMETE